MRFLPATDDNIALAAGVLAAGGLVAFPTETVYGLGADAFNPTALARVFEAKKRPRFDPLIVHIAALDALDRLVDFAALPRAAGRLLDTLASRLWPGPLTLVLPKRPEVPDLATSGLPSVAVRFPSHPAACRLIALSTGAVAAPSANPFGRLSPTRAEHVLSGLAESCDIILDGGPAAVGVESTVLDLCGLVPVILREGGTPREALEEVLAQTLGEGISTRKTGVSLMPPKGPPQAARAPGQLPSHYAPAAPLFLHTAAEIAVLPPDPQAAWLFFDQAARETWEKEAGTAKHRDSPRVRVLSPGGSAVEAAAALFQTLHELDALGPEKIHAERAPDAGLGRAINDRLERAQAKHRAEVG